MRRNNTVNPRLSKITAKQKYAERQIAKFAKWSFKNRGFIKFKDIVKLQDKYNIKCYG
jgi:hypothetical protein